MFGYGVMLAALALFIFRGLKPTVNVLCRIFYGDEQAIADAEARKVREKIEAIDEEILGKKLNEIRVRIGLRQL
jgi:hypothetical protein